MKISDVTNMDIGRGPLVVLLVLLAGAMVFAGKMSVSEWTEFAKWMGLGGVAGITATKTAAALKGNWMPAGVAAAKADEIKPSKADATKK